MGANLQFLSPSLVIIVNKLLEDQELLKLINYNTPDALIQQDITNPKSLIKTRIFPYRYRGVMNEIQTQIRVYYGNSKIQNKHIEKTPVIFECITHSDLILVNDPNEVYDKLERLYEIAPRIINLYDNVSINTVGRLNFTDCIPLEVMPENYLGIRLIAEMTNFG